MSQYALCIESVISNVVRGSLIFSSGYLLAICCSSAEL